MAQTKPRTDPGVLDELLQRVNNEGDLTGVLRQLSKQLIERMLEAELTEHLGHDPGEVVINPEGNVRNGSSKKTLKGELGQVDLDIPRDRQGNFEPQLVKKHQRRLAGLDERILSLAIMQAPKKWTMPIRDWKKALNWFAQLFGARLLDKLGIQNS